VPTPLFDTQIAAMVCGFGEQASYETLVRRIARVELDKSSRFTDWRRRPLTERQIAYAAGDVTHLRVVYETLAHRLAETGRGAWVAEEMAVLAAPETYAARPEDAWKRLRSRTANRRFLGVLKAVAAWRERLAQERDTPRNRVLRDEALLEIASHPPHSIEDLQALRGVPGGFGNSAWGRALVEAVTDAQELPADELPPNDRPPHTANIGPLVELLRVLLKLRADENEVAQRLIAAQADLERIAAEDEADVPALHGWRREIFGDAALALKGGRIALAASGSQVRTLPLDDEMAEALKPPPPRARSRRRRRAHAEATPATGAPSSPE
jgi:ribonuclease D